MARIPRAAPRRRMPTAYRWSLAALLAVALAAAAGHFILVTITRD